MSWRSDVRSHSLRLSALWTHDDEARDDPSCGIVSSRRMEKPFSGNFILFFSTYWFGSNQSYSTYCKVLRLWSFKFFRPEKQAITNEVVWVLGFYSRQTNRNRASTSCLVYYNQRYYVLYFLKLVSDDHWVCLLRERLPTSFGLHCCSSQIVVPKIKTWYEGKLALFTFVTSCTGSRNHE